MNENDPELVDFLEVSKESFGAIIYSNLILFVLQKCLTIDPKHRLTPLDAFEHPWIKRAVITKAYKSELSRSACMESDGEGDSIAEFRSI